MSANTHSTATLASLIALLKATSSGVKFIPLRNGLCRCCLYRYAGSPYIHNWLPFAECENCLNSPSRLDSLNIATSCFLPSMGPKRFAINPFGVTTDLVCICLPKFHLQTPNNFVKVLLNCGLSGNIVQENLETAKVDLMLSTSVMMVKYMIQYPV